MLLGGSSKLLKRPRVACCAEWSFIFSPRIIFFDLSPGRAIKRSNYKLPVQEAVPLLISIEAVASAKTLVVRKIGDHLPRACSWMGRPMATYLEAIEICVCVDQKVI